MNLTIWEPLLHLALWGSLAIVVYTYVGYPLVLMVWSLLRARPVAYGQVTPTVTVVIAARNEASRLVARINNICQQHYPADLLDVVVVSDGSTDTTEEEVIRRFDQERVSLIKLGQHQGKAVALNTGVTAARGEIVVFADARQRFAPTAVAELVSNFTDPRVGAVCGTLVLETDPGRPGPNAMGFYWHIEKWIREKEGSIDSVIGATGAIYAIRRKLFEPLPVGTILDDVLVPMRIAMRNYRVTFESRALAFDRVEQDYKTEFRRKVRTLAGNYQAISLCPDLVKPWRNRLFFLYFSHKVCRLAAPFFLIAILIANISLIDGWLSYLLAVQAIGYAMALAGWGLISVGVRERWTSAAFTFCLLNYAALLGAIKFIKGDTALWGRT